MAKKTTQKTAMSVANTRQSAYPPVNASIPMPKVKPPAAKPAAAKSSGSSSGSKSK